MKKNKTLINISLPTLLVIIFTVLKLTGHITWDWVWVFSPWLIPITFIFLITGLFLIFVLVVEFYDWIRGNTYF